MFNIPVEISDEEYKKFKELLEEKKQKELGEKISREIYIQKLSENVDMLLNLNKSYGPVEAYALTFVKFLMNDFEAQGTNTLWFNWSEIKRYLTDRCLTKNFKGQDELKKTFKNHLADRGIRTKINRKYDTLKVWKTRPKKRIKI